jgi:hypothetical protein
MFARAWPGIARAAPQRGVGLAVAGTPRGALGHRRGIVRNLLPASRAPSLRRHGQRPTDAGALRATVAGQCVLARAQVCGAWPQHVERRAGHRHAQRGAPAQPTKSSPVYHGPGYHPARDPYAAKGRYPLARGAHPSAALPLWQDSSRTTIHSDDGHACRRLETRTACAYVAPNPHGDLPSALSRSPGRRRLIAPCGRGRRQEGERHEQ